MSSGMPELGSKISLISKADIRYEGRLFTVDPQECTIALASVRSFGTEDRETQFPVAPQNQVYDYILFRGSDIKDIRVVNNVPSLPNDPAIMQLSMPATLGGGPPQGNFQQPQFNHPVVGGTPYPSYHPMSGLPGGLRPTMQPLNKQPSSMLEMIGGGSRSETPVTRKSPTVEQGTQMGPSQVTPGSTSGPSGTLVQQNHHNQGNQQNRNNNNRMHNNNRNNQQQNNRPRSQNRNNNQLNNMNQHHQNQHHQNQHHQNHHQNQHQNHYQNQHQNMHQRQNWGRGRGGGMMNMRGGRGAYPNNRGGGYPNNRGNNKKNTLKFDNDYDFELANTEFEELRSQLAKVKIEGEQKPEVETTEKKEDSGNETGAGEAEPEDDAVTSGYDKARSFFDNISCEAVERSKGRLQRTDWRAERKLNSETFGVATARRGAYRGRGYWGGRGGGQQGGGGGGGWGGWRGGQNRQQNNRNNNNRQNNNKGQPQQQPTQPLASQ